MQFGDFCGQNGAAPPTEYFDVPGAFFAQQVVHVFEKLVVPALVGSDGNPLCIFLNGGVDNLLHRTVVAQVDDFRAAALHDAAHDVDGCVVPVEQRSRGDDADFVGGLVGCGLLHDLSGLVRAGAKLQTLPSQTRTAAAKTCSRQPFIYSTKTKNNQCGSSSTEGSDVFLF